MRWLVFEKGGDINQFCKIIFLHLEMDAAAAVVTIWEEDIVRRLLVKEMSSSLLLSQGKIFTPRVVLGT